MRTIQVNETTKSLPLSSHLHAHTDYTLIYIYICMLNMHVRTGLWLRVPTHTHTYIHTYIHSLPDAAEENPPRES